MMVLIIGGSGSGKSAYAEEYIGRIAGMGNKYIIGYDYQMSGLLFQALDSFYHRIRNFFTTSWIFFRIFIQKHLIGSQI